MQSCSVTAFDFSQGIVPANAQAFSNLANLGWCDLFQLISNILGFLSFIAVPIATVAFFWGGFTLLIAAGNESKIKKGKDILLSAVKGVAIVVGANIIIKAVFIAFGIDVSILPWA